MINLNGWTHVHTWHESHGDHSDAVYQRDIDPDRAVWQGRRVELLHVTTYHRTPQPTGLRTESGKHAHDYLLAREIRANPERYRPAGEQHISPCCTAGADDFEDTRDGRLYRIFGAAGHGEWAFEIQPEDLGRGWYD